MKKALIIMVKIPDPGKVKTRLRPRLSEDQAAAFAACLLHDTINKAAGNGNQLIIAYSPFDRREFFEDFSQHNFILTPQIGDDLGERMFHAFEFAFGRETDSAVMIGTDSPTLPVKLIDRAFELLNNSDAVLGPTEDGGYYLIGLNRVRKELFENVEWSSEKTFEQTISNLEKFGLKSSVLPIWYDVDHPLDLDRLGIELKGNPQIAPATAEWIRENLDD